MKACNQIQELLSLFLEGETSPEETRHITEHLSSCQECKKALEELKKTVELVKNLDEVEPPPFFTQKIMAHVREEAALSRVTGHGSRQSYQDFSFPFTSRYLFRPLPWSWSSGSSSWSTGRSSRR